MQRFAWFLPEHMAIVGGELTHVREAPTGSNFHDFCCTDIATQQIVACRIQPEYLGEPFGGCAEVIPERVLERATAGAGNAAKIVNGLRNRGMVHEMLFNTARGLGSRGAGSVSFARRWLTSSQARRKSANELLFEFQCPPTFDFRVTSKTVKLFGEPGFNLTQRIRIARNWANRVAELIGEYRSPEIPECHFGVANDRDAERRNSRRNDQVKVFGCVGGEYVTRT